MSENLGQLGSKQDDDSNSAFVGAGVVVTADVVIAIVPSWVVVVLVEVVLVAEVMIELIVTVETGSL